MQVFTTKKLEIESGKFKVIKPKRKGQSLSAAIAALKEPIEESDDDNDDSMETDSRDGPMWQLFDQLYNAANASGRFHITVFKLCCRCFIALHVFSFMLLSFYFEIIFGLKYVMFHHSHHIYTHGFVLPPFFFI